MNGWPNDFWPWAWVTYSPPAESFREVSERWEQERLDQGSAGLHWWFIGGIVGLIMAASTSC